MDDETNKWALALHLSQLAHFIPLGGIVIPIVIWQVKKDDLPGIDAHGRNVVNWTLSWIVYCIAAIPLILLFGLGLLILWIIPLLTIVFAIVGGVKAYSGETWKYPLTVDFL